jgi:hypothetical protein
VRAFLKKHEFGNAGWEDLVKEFETSSKRELQRWGEVWVKQRGLPMIRSSIAEQSNGLAHGFSLSQVNLLNETGIWELSFSVLQSYESGEAAVQNASFSRIPRYVPGKVPIDDNEPASASGFGTYQFGSKRVPALVFPNYQDYGYGIFLLDDKSREYVLKNIQNEKDPFLRSMMWGALWDSVREGELDPWEYVELVVRVLSKSDAFTRSPGGPPKASAATETPKGVTLTEDESTTALLLNRVGTAMNYYIDAGVSSPHVSKGSSRPSDTVISKNKSTPAIARQAPDEESRALTNVRATDTADTDTSGLGTRVEEMLIAGMQNSPAQGQRITYYRAFLNMASSEKARGVLKGMLKSQLTTPSAEAAATPPSKGGESRANASGGEDKPPATAGGADSGRAIPIKTKDKFDIVTRLLILNDPEAPKLLAELEKAETSDDAKRYAYAAKAGIPTAENKAKYWNDFVSNKEISESWIEAAFGPWNSIRHSEMTLPYLERALKELPNHKRNRKIFFVNGWLGAFIGGQRSEEALATVNKFLADNPNLDNDLRLKILENVDVIERAVKIRQKHDR